MKYEKQNIFFISDLHIGHKNVLKFDGRPFADVDEMHIEMIKRWNEVVDDDDIVYYLGDLAFARDELTKWFIYSLKGKINFILGNHDKMKDIIKFGRWENIHEYGTEINVKDEDTIGSRGSNGYQRIIMSHYPILSWNKSHYGSWHLHGHCHGSLIKSNQDYYKRKVMDVGCNVIDYTPISYEKVKGIMVKKGISSVDHHGEEDM
jgi:calcineurin-like phosphoesterase family protein